MASKPSTSSDTWYIDAIAQHKALFFNEPLPANSTTTNENIGDSIFTHEQDAGISSKMGNWYKPIQDKIEVDKKKSLSIKYLSNYVDKENFNINFEVKSNNLSVDTASIYVDEIDSLINDVAIQKTNIKIKKTGTTSIKLSFSKDKNFTELLFDDGNSFKATINCDGLSAETNEFKLNFENDKNKDCNLIEPKAVISNKLTLTNEEQAKFIATIYGEASTAENQFEPFCWVYFNLVSRQGFEKGMSNSYAYKDKNYLYKDALKNYTTGKIPSVNKIKEIVENKILADKPLNPYPEWEGQGYYGDMNIRAPKTSYRRVWAYASQYFHLQNQCKVKAVLVKEYIAERKDSKEIVTDITGYIYNFNEIEKYFKNHSKDLPEYEIGECENDILSYTQKNAIPAVHRVDKCNIKKK